MQRLNLNLATKPLRNRRLFMLLAGLLGLAFLVTAFLAVFFLLQVILKKDTVRADMKKADKTIRTARSEQKQLSTRVQEAAKKNQDIVDTINSIILRKSFSWTDFLSKLEECLPDTSYILSLAPTLVHDNLVQFRFRVVSPGLDELLALINKLQAMKFSQPRVETEEKDDRGQLTSDISVTYERII